MNTAKALALLTGSVGAVVIQERVWYDETGARHVEELSRETYEKEH